MQVRSKELLAAWVEIDLLELDLATSVLELEVEVVSSVAAVEVFLEPLTVVEVMVVEVMVPASPKVVILDVFQVLETLPLAYVLYVVCGLEVESQVALALMVVESQVALALMVVVHLRLLLGMHLWLATVEAKHV